ncbi:Serine/threonine protein kinase [Handroanthus impetiginosus]|uniref:Serine/threonine protein kinase n=1 Tax=Handroanthus impetiginosus TaxID=429701 RepID=A0A2G9G4U1_9LAMI|nr:Serine/threonine protein kinase [Handroanthus impetiginosus]
MSAIYDNWERLVATVLKKEELWQLFHDHSRSPSILSEASSYSSSSNLSALDLLSLGSSSRLHKALPKLVLISDFSLAFRVNDLHRASAKLLGKGTFGSSYTATVGNGAKIVVKRLKSVSISEQHFKHYMDIIGNVRHENVAPLRAYYSSKDEHLMLYDYYSEGSVYALLHDDGVKIVVKRLKSVSIFEQDFKRHIDIVGNVTHENMAPLRAYYSSKDEQLMLYDYYSGGSVYALLHGQTSESQAHVDWGTRLKIVIGVARGIAEIHKQTGAKLVHGNIKSSNIFISPQHYGCVSDLGLADMIETTFRPNARKSTKHLPGGPEPVDLVKLVGSVKSKGMAVEVFDEDLLKHPSIKEDMVKMLQIGLKCVSKSKKKRPKMSEVVKMLDDIGKVNPESRFLSERKLVIVEGAILLGDVLFVEALGRGPFGTHYGARLENGNAIVVMRLRDVPIAFEEFQQHMEVIEGMRHENIVELRACYFSRNEKLLVYDYYNQGSVFAALHSDCTLEVIDTNKVSQASDVYSFGIVLLELLTGKLSQGMIYVGRVMSLVDWIKSLWNAAIAFDVELLRYLDDEEAMVQVNKTRNVSQASDVYSFGILLLELLTRKSTEHLHGGPEPVDLVRLVGSVKSKERVLL